MLRRVGLFFYLLWLKVPAFHLKPAVGLSLSLLLVWGVGYLTGLREYSLLEREIENLSERLGASPPNANPITRLVLLEKDISLVKRTLSEVKEDLYQKEREIEDLTEQIHFYRSVVAPETKQNKLDVFSVRVGSPIGDREYPIELVIRRTARESAVKGRMSLHIRGQQDGEEKTLDVSEVLEDGGRMSFRYFQRFSGRLRLPEGYEPWVLLVRATSRKHGTIEKTYRWADVLADAAGRI